MMALDRKGVTLAAIASFVAWGYAVNWLPSLRWVGYAFLAGLIVPIILLAGLVLCTSRGNLYRQRNRLHRSKVASFQGRIAWAQDLEALRKRQLYKRQPLYGESFYISDALDELLELIGRDFVKSWYSNISSNPVFPNEVDKTIRLAIISLRDRLLGVDLVDVVITRLVPIMTAHFRNFDKAEKAVRGRHLNRNVTESEELDLAIAGKYNDGKIHPAASLSYSDTRFVQQSYLRELVQKLLPKLLPSSIVTSRAVLVLIKELVAGAVLAPIMQMLADPDTWDQIMEGYGRTMLQDRSTVRKLRAALDEHASPAPHAKRNVSFPRLSPLDSERKFEKFIRAIRKVNNLSDARRFRSEVSSQIKRDVRDEAHDPVYIRRLEIGEKILDQKVSQLASGGDNGRLALPNMPRPKPSMSKLENVSLIDLLHDSSGLSYFMEYMDRQKLMPMVQFWIVVDGFRNPLEDDLVDGEDMPIPAPRWTESDRADLAQINEAYMSRPELRIYDRARQDVRDFLRAGKNATPEQYAAARRAILNAQTSALEEMKERHFPNFKKSDLFYKYLTSEEASKKAMATSSPNTQASILSLKPSIPQRVSTSQVVPTKPSPIVRVPSRFISRKTDLHRAALSSTDLSAANSHISEEVSVSRSSLDEIAPSPLFDDDDTGGEDLSTSVNSLDCFQDESYNNSTPDTHIVRAMEAALNDIMEDTPNVDELRSSIFETHDSPEPSFMSPQDNDSFRSSMDAHRNDYVARDGEKPNLASLGLVNTSSRIGVFTDDDLFPDEAKFISDEHDDPEDDGVDKDTDEDVHEAAPGDLGLAEAIEALTTDVDRLMTQNAVIDSLIRKAELTNNTAELRILRKSKSSLQREIRRKEMQRQQYIIQESDNSLYGRSTIKIKSVVVGKEEDGREYAVYVVEVHRKAGEQMPAAAWSITRRYSEFHELHQRLRFKYPSVRHLDFPRRRVVMKLQSDFLHKRRLALEKYLRELLLLPDVCRSRDLRAFLSQSAIAPGSDTTEQEDKKDMMTRLYNSVTDGMEDILGNIPVLDQLSVAGQSLLSAATNQLSTMPSTISEDPLTAAEAEAELNAFENRELEPFVKPICDIFLEIFELNRGNNWLRGRAVVVVLHQLLGGTIERKVRDNVNSLIHDDAIVRYISLVRDSLWPDGKLKQDAKTRTANEKAKSRKEASLMLATLIPDLAGSVVGRVNAKAASRRIFATFNNPRLNVHLTFTMLDELIDVLFGDIRK